MLDQLPVIQFDDASQQVKLLVNGQPCSIITRGFLIKQQYILDAERRVWFTVRKRGENAFRLLFASGRKYQLEVLSYATTAYVFYDHEDTEIFRLTLSVDFANTICLLLSVEDIPREELVGLMVWGFYCWRSVKEKKYSCKPAA